MIRSIRLSLGAALGLLAVLGLLSFGTTLWTVRSQRHDAVVINLAGTERYLSQRIAKLALLAIQQGQVSRYRTEIVDGIQAWESTFQALRDGGEVFYAGRTVRLPPTTDPALRAQLELIWDAWQRFRAASLALLKTSPDQPGFSQALGEVESLSEAVLRETDRAVGLYEALARERVAKVEWIQAAYLAAGALVVILAYLSIYYWILIPLALLQGRVEGLISGDLASPVPVAAENEIGILGSAFEVMRGLLWRRITEGEVLLRLSRELLGVHDLQAIARATFAAIREHLRPDAVSLLMVDARREHLEIFAAEGWAEPFVGSLRLPLQPPDSSGAAWAVHTRAPVHEDHSRTDRPFGVRDEVLKAGVQASLNVPLLVEEEAIGLLVLDSLAPRTFSEDEVHLLTLVANQTALAAGRARLFERLRLFKEAFDNAADLVMITDLEPSILEVNPAFERVTGFSREEALGQKPSLIMSPRTTLEFYRQMWDSILGRGHWIGEITNRRKDGEEWDSWLAISTVRDERGRPVAYLGIARDITASKRLQREREVLLESEQMRRAELSALFDLSRALAGAAHDTDVILDLVTRRAVEIVGVTFARAAMFENGECVVRSAHPRRVLGADLGVGLRETAGRLPTCHRVAGQEAAVVLRRDDPTLTEFEREMLFLGVAQTLCLVPMRAGDRALGLLMLGEVRREEREPFTQEKVRLATSIGDQAASALRRAELFGQLERSYLEAVIALAGAIDARDHYTADHSQRLSSLALAVGRELGMSPSELEDLRYGALLHDIGKIGIPDAILRKPGALDPDEWQQIRRHPGIGAGILVPVARLAGAAEIVRHHHERYDGRGYPDGVAGDAIPLGARILNAVDSYIAMLDTRPYKGPRTQEEALAELRRCSGSQFDPRVIEVLIRLLERGFEPG